MISEKLKKKLLESKVIVKDKDYGPLVDLVIQSRNLDVQDKYGFTILHYLIGIPETIELITEILESGANLNIQNINGRTILMYSAMAGNLVETKLFIKYGAKKNICDVAGHSALDFAKAYGHTNVINLLNPPEITKEDIKEQSVQCKRLPIRIEHRLLEVKKMIIAEFYEYPERARIDFFSMINMVLSTKNLDIQDEYGRTILSLAIKYHMKDLASELLLCGAKPNELFGAALIASWNIEYINMVELLLSYGANTNIDVEYIKSCVISDEENIKKILDMIEERIAIRAAKPIELKEEDFQETKNISENLRNALQKVLEECSDLEICEMVNFILIGNDVNFQNLFGNTLLMILSSVDIEKTFKTSITSIDIMRLLLINHADTNIKNNEGDSALVYVNNLAKLQLLIDFGIDITNYDLQTKRKSLEKIKRHQL